jgi:hypothetical protein
VLELESAIETLACLHQRSRRLIRHVELEIPTFNEILDRFQETVRLSLRYCSGLKKFEVNMPFAIPGADGSNTTGNTSVYANGFDILRWLPQDCDVVVHGRACSEVDDVVSKHLTLAKTLNKVGLRIIAPERAPAHFRVPARQAPNNANRERYSWHTLADNS